MTPPHAKISLQDSLIALLPGGQISAVSQTNWYSATFSGIRVSIGMTVAGRNAQARANALQTALPDQEFSLRRYLVADIAVTSIIPSGGTVQLEIEALLIEE